MIPKTISSINAAYINSSKPVRQQEVKPKKSSKVIKGVSVAAAVGVTALVVGSLLYKNKISPNILKVNDAIDFKEAKTLKEALEYGKNVLGIKKYAGFEENDLDVVNWINEGLTLCANNAKSKNQIIMPRKVLYTDLSVEPNWKAAINSFNDLVVSKNGISDIKNNAINLIKQCDDSQEVKDKIIKAMDFKTAHKICANAAKGSKFDTLSWQNGMFSTIAHEMGHLQHKFNVKNANFFYSLGALEHRPKKLAKGAKELLELFNSKQDVAAKVSTYAKESPCEFIAEVYSKLAHGLKLDDDVMELYQKLGGVV